MRMLRAIPNHSIVSSRQWGTGWCARQCPATGASRYLPEDGTITFSVAAHPPHGATTPGERDVIVRVRDLGAGVARDQPDPIFARFHRIPQGASHDFAEARRGMGIGLFRARTCTASRRGKGGAHFSSSPCPKASHAPHICQSTLQVRNAGDGGAASVPPSSHIRRKLRVQRPIPDARSSLRYGRRRADSTIRSRCPSWRRSGVRCRTAGSPAP